jgi:hypothetical protein
VRGLFALHMGGLAMFRPWLRPHERLWKPYLLTLTPVLLSAAALLWRLGRPLANPWLSVQLLMVLPVLLLPLLFLGRKTWARLHHPSVE